MVTAKNNLEDLVMKGLILSGTDASVIVVQIRKYINAIPRAQLLTELSQITEQKELRFLQGVGIPGFAQDIFFAQWQKVSTSALL